nr:acylneuraminate cytidylyltransferase family protein [Reyranella sp. MMS21-HV4-11]
MRVYALVPARSGSKGLPDKNILEIDGCPLIAWAIRFGLALGIDRVILSTDSDRYAQLGLAHGAECPFLRSGNASTDTAREEDILEDLHNRLPQSGIELPDVWVWLKPTSPFRKLASVHEALAILKSRPEIDSVRLVSEGDARLQIVNRDGYLEPLLKEWPEHLSKIPRTHLVKVYHPYSLEIFRHSGWVTHRAAFMGKRILPIVQSRITGLDIDDRDGFDIIKALIEARPRAPIISEHLPP